MGPIQPSEKERAERRALARRIVEAVEADEHPPAPLHLLLLWGPHAYEIFLQVFCLAKETAMLAEELRQRDATIRNLYETSNA